MNYTQTLDYLFSRLPIYQRIGAAAYKADNIIYVPIKPSGGKTTSAFKLFLNATSFFNLYS